MKGLLIGGGIAVVIAGALWLLWLGPAYRKGRKEQVAIRKINGFDKLETDWIGRVTTVSLKGARDADVKQLVDANPSAMYDLRIAGGKLTDAALKQIGELPQLRGLDLTDTPIGETGIDQLAEMKQLERLNLTGTGVEHKDVKRIEEAVPGISVRY